MTAARGANGPSCTAVGGPKWHHVLGVAASGAVTVLDGNGNLLFMHLRQKEATAGIVMDEMADEILERLPALLRGEPQH